MHTDFAVVNTEAIKAGDGVTLQSIQVSWRYSQAYYNCTESDMYSLVAEITVYTRTTIYDRRSSYITSEYYLTFRDNQLEIFNPDCNTQHSVILRYRNGVQTYRARSHLPFFYGSKLESDCNHASITFTAKLESGEQTALLNCSEIPNIIIYRACNIILIYNGKSLHSCKTA